MSGDEFRYTGWTMDVAKDVRPVCSIPFFLPAEPILAGALG